MPLLMSWFAVKVLKALVILLSAFCVFGAAPAGSMVAPAYAQSQLNAPAQDERSAQPLSAETGAQTNGPAASAGGAQPRTQKLERWNRTLDSIQQAVGRDGVTDVELQRQSLEALAFRPEVTELIEQINPEVQRLRQQLEELGAAPGEGQTPEAAELNTRRESLQGEISRLDALQRAARLVNVRIEQIESAALKERRSRFVRSLSVRTYSVFSPALWSRSIAGLGAYARSLNLQFGDSTSFAARQLRQRPVEQALFFLQCAALIGFYLLIARRLDRRFRGVGIRGGPASANRPAMEHFKVFLALCILPALLLLGLSIVLGSNLLFPEKFRQLLNAVFASAAFFAVTSGLLRLFLAPAAPERRIATLADGTARSAFNAGIVAVALIAALRVFNFSVVQLLAPFETSVALSALVATTAVSAAAWAMWLVQRDSEWQSEASIDRSIIRWQTIAPLVWIACAIAAVGLVSGYVALSEFTAYQIIAVLIIASTLWLFVRLIDETRDRLLIKPRRQGGRAAVKSATGRQVVVIAFGLARLLAFIFAIFALLVPWGIRSQDMLALLGRAYFGFQIGDLTISLSSLMTAVAIFVISLLAAGQIKNWVGQQYLPTTRLDLGIRNSIVTVLGYAGIMVAATLAIMAAGLDLSRLALVFGALSVGIGFGLQSIVNNFVSGLILLAERPIQSGDWVVTSGGQGTVRRISVRSTEIETFDGATIVVPNSTLITEPVTNWYHRNKQGRVTITIGVSYSSDPEQVRDLLHRCAREHPLVLDTPAPQIFFMDYGADALIFDLRVFLADIGQTLTVSSDLRFAILKELRHAGIEIPFPQRDLHIRSGALVANAINGEQADDVPGEIGARPELAPLPAVRGRD
jgi:potassium-dependent mechanosensitive channel